MLLLYLLSRDRALVICSRNLVPGPISEIPYLLQIQVITARFYTAILQNTTNLACICICSRC